MTAIVCILWRVISHVRDLSLRLAMATVIRASTAPACVSVSVSMDFLTVPCCGSLSSVFVQVSPPSPPPPDLVNSYLFFTKVDTSGGKKDSWERKTFPLTLFGVMIGAFEFKLTRDRLATEQPEFIAVGNAHTHGSDWRRVTQRGARNLGLM